VVGLEDGFLAFQFLRNRQYTGSEQTFEQPGTTLRSGRSRSEVDIGMRSSACSQKILRGRNRRFVW